MAVGFTMLGGWLCSRYIKGVADFVVAGRNVRPFLALSSGQAEAMGLISIAITCQEGYLRGLSNIWFTVISLVIVVGIYGIGGFVIVRYRELKLMTIPQFYELRYSKGLRITVGFVTAISGILNMAIFPIVGAQFLVHFVGFPTHFAVGGYPITMIPFLTALLIALSLFFTYVGGMVSVILTDYIQSVTIAILLILTSIVLVSQVGFDRIHETLMARGQASFNPFSEHSYGVVWMIVVVLQQIFGFVAFAPTMQKIASVNSGSTAKKLASLGTMMGAGRQVVLLLWGVAAFAVLGAAVPDGTSAEQYSRIATANYLGDTMPVVAKGLALAGMVAAFVSVTDSYFLAWGAIIVNDIIAPMKKKPMSPRSHIWILRVTIACIAMFIYLFGVIYTPTESILSYITVTGAMFLGAGIIMIGGLYWKRSTTPAAYAAVLVCCAVPVVDLISKQVLNRDYPLTGPQSSLIGILLGLSLFVGISLVTKRHDKALGKI